MGKGRKKKKRSKNRRRRNSAKARELQDRILSWAYPSPDRVRRCLLVLLTLCVIAIGLISADRILPVEQVSYIVQGSRVETRHGKSTTHKVTLFRLINGQESFETELHTEKVLAGFRVEFQKTGLIGHRLAETISRPVVNGETGFVVFKEQKSSNILSLISLTLLAVESLLLLLFYLLPDQFVERLTGRTGNFSFVLVVVGSILVYFTPMAGSILVLVGFGVFCASFASDFEDNLRRPTGF